MGHLNGCEIDVLIVGAGPTGLAMAAEASRFNLRYRIIDKSPHGARFSQAVLVQTRTLEQFERYGIAEQAVALGRRLRRIRFYSEGQRVLESSFDDLPGPYPFVLFLPQPQTERLPLMLLSGIMLPLSLAPDLLRNIAKFNPFTYAVDASRSLVAGQFGADSVVKAFVIIAVLAILTIFWATRSMRQAAM